MKTIPCPCGSQKSYQSCCGNYIDGSEAAPTPEALMRSRYTAYSIANIGYIKKTMADAAVANFNAKEAKKWAKSVRWVKLQVIHSHMDENNPARGTVEFKAYYRKHAQEHCLHENSEFILRDGQWFYVGEAGKIAVSLLK